MKVRITPSFIAAVVLVLLVLASVIVTIGIWIGLWGAIDVSNMLLSFILNWVLVITFAILGGILFGMFIGYRLTSSDFTPFEKSMLQMFKTVEEIDRRLKRVEKAVGAEGLNIPEESSGTGVDASGGEEHTESPEMTKEE